MYQRRKPYTPEEVKEDLKNFFEDSNHWAFQYGDSTPKCNPNSPFHRKQIEVIFEDKYDHWDLNTQVDVLIKSGFLRLEKKSSAHFILRNDVRYYKRNIKERLEIIAKYSAPVITKAIGNWGEFLSEMMFRLNGFKIVGRNTNRYRNKVWTKTDENLDFILEKDDIPYGVEIKNTLDYMEYDEFTNKLNMCKELGLIPLWILRNAPEVQFNTMKANNGLIIAFKSQIYPFGHEDLVERVWKLMRLPVCVKSEMPPKTLNSLLSFHTQNKQKYWESNK